MVVLNDFMSWCLKFLCCWRLLYVFIFLVKFSFLIAPFLDLCLLVPFYGETF